MTHRTSFSSSRLASRLLCLASLFVSLAVPFAGALAQASQSQLAGRVGLGTRTAAFAPAAADAGALPATQPLTLTLTLATSPARTAALEQFLTAQMTPGSASYHQWLTPARFAAQYGAAASDLAAATAWAEAQGFSDITVSPSGLRLTVQATAAQANAAFAVNLHQYQWNGVLYFAATGEASVPQAAGRLIAAVDGLDDLPAGTMTASYVGAQGAVSAEPQTLASLGSVVDGNVAPVIALNSTVCSASVSAAQVLGYRTLFEQAAAQGMTTIVSRGCTAGAFPAALAEVTAVSAAGDTPETAAPLVVRPAWQSAPGLPADELRHIPDLTATSLSALAQTLTAIAAKTPSGRLGNANPTLYELAPVSGLYTQPDEAAAGTWEPATGLGTVDLGKLERAYATGSGMSYTALAVSNYVPVHGQGTSFTVNVTSGTGGATPTGTVSIVANGVTLATVALANGTAAYSTNQLAGGQYTIAANYSGDSTYAPSSNPSPASIYVSPEQVNLGVQVSGGAVIGGTFNVIVTDTAPSGVGIPTGSVTVTLPVNGSNYTGTLAAAGTSSSAATVVVPATIVGTLTLSVNCTSSTSYACNNPYTTNVTVAKATPSLSINYSPNPPVSGQSITLNATVTGVGTAPTPTGNVQFFDNNTTLNSGALNSGSTTTVGTVPTTSTHSITATYQGDANYNPVSTTAGSTTSGAIATSLSLSASATTVVAGQNITFTAILTPASTGSANPTGSVQFFDNGTTLLGTSSLSSNVATLIIATLSPSVNHVVTAVYTGDTLYTGSTSGSVTVAKSNTLVATTLGLSSTVAAYTAGTPFNLVATITPATTSATGPSGTVQFYSNGVALGTSVVSSNAAVYTATFTSGTQVITATYSGDGTYATSTASGLTLNKSTATTATATALSISPTTQTQGGTLTLSAIVTPTVNNIAPTGAVQFYQGTALACTAQLSGSIASCSVVAGTIGTFSYTADYVGDSNYSTSVSAAVSVTVTAPLATLTASISPQVAPGATSATVSATLVAPNGTVPMGQITATILGVTGAVYNATLPGTANTSTVTVQIPVTAPTVAGTYNVVVSCAGTNFSCSPVTVSFASTGGGSTTGKIATTTTLTSNVTTIPTSGAVTLTATVTPATTSSVAPTGMVSFYNGTTLLGSGTLAAATTAYTAILNVTLSASASYSITAVYAGDTNYAMSTSTALTLGTGTTTGTTPGITLTSNVGSALAGSAIVFTVDITGNTTKSSNPTGTVSLYLAGTNPTLIGTAPVGSAGTGLSVATLSTNNLPAGALTIYAVYSGDTNFSSGQSNSITVGLDSYSVTLNPSSLILRQGQSGSSTLTLGLINGFTGTVTFGCTPRQNVNLTCSFSKTLLTNGGSTVLTVNTFAPTTAWLTGQPPLGVLGGVTLAGLLCWLLPGRNRRRLPTLLLLALALGLSANLGCQSTVSVSTGLNNGGTPLGTSVVTVSTVGSDGVNTASQNYTVQVTVQ